jgi:hypothetical protein
MAETPGASAPVMLERMQKRTPRENNRAVTVRILRLVAYYANAKVEPFAAA